MTPSGIPSSQNRMYIMADPPFDPFIRDVFIRDLPA